MLRFRNKRLFIFLTGIIILVVLIGYSLSNRKQLTTPEQFIQDTIGWTQQAISLPVHYVKNVVKNVNEIKYTFEENKILKEKLAEYKGLIYEVQQLKKENEELRTILD